MLTNSGSRVMMMLRTVQVCLDGSSAELPLHEEVTTIQGHKHAGECNRDLIECELHHWEDLVTADTSN